MSELNGNTFSLRTVFLVPLQGHLQNAVADLRKQIDCKTVGFFSQNQWTEIGKAWRKSLTRAKCVILKSPYKASEVKKKNVSLASIPSLSASASFQIFCLTARAFLNTQK